MNKTLKRILVFTMLKVSEIGIMIAISIGLGFWFAWDLLEKFNESILFGVMIVCNIGALVWLYFVVKANWRWAKKIIK